MIQHTLAHLLKIEGGYALSTVELTKAKEKYNTYSIIKVVSVMCVTLLCFLLVLQKLIQVFQR